MVIVALIAVVALMKGRGRVARTVYGIGRVNRKLEGLLDGKVAARGGERKR